MPNDQVSPVSSSEAHSTEAPPAAHAANKAPPSGYTNSTTVNSMEDLKQKAPKVFDAMQEGVAIKICNSMRDHQDRMKKINAEARRDSEGG